MYLLLVTLILPAPAVPALSLCLHQAFPAVSLQVPKAGGPAYLSSINTCSQERNESSVISTEHGFVTWQCLPFKVLSGIVKCEASPTAEGHQRAQKGPV